MSSLPEGVPHTKTAHGVAVPVRVVPRSSKVEVVGPVAGALKVKLTAPPVGGAANRQLIDVLAGYFGVRKSAVRIVRGHGGKSKLVEISMDQP
jgi:uncharacterized protein (TIGR00251 family)